MQETQSLSASLCACGSAESGAGRHSSRKQQQYTTHLARATLIRQPPLKSFSFFLCMAGVNPKPWRIREARASALSASSSSRRSYNSKSFSHSAEREPACQHFYQYRALSCTSVQLGKLTVHLLCHYPAPSIPKPETILKKLHGMISPK